MSKRRTKEEINEIKVYVKEIGLDTSLNEICKTKDQVEKLFEIQEDMKERCTTYFNIKARAPKDKNKDYKSAIGARESLAVYLYDSEQLEALATLRKVEIKENEPRITDYLNRNKAVLVKKVEDLGFSKTSTKVIVAIFMEYLKGKYQDKYIEFESGSLYKQTKKYIADGNHIPIIK